MSDWILHHYDLSPFSEKVRVLFGMKGLAWKAVEQPVIAPKPDLTPLTGGYRRIPVLQIGADIWCDTAIIAQAIEERAGGPTIYPGGRGAHELIAQWADRWLFLAVVPLAIVKMGPMLPPAFIADRQKMSPNFTAESLSTALPTAKSRIVAALDWLEAQLSVSPFLLGEKPGVADAAVYHCIWFLRADPESFAGVESRPGIKRWFETMIAIGHGTREPLAPADALAIAHAATPNTDPVSDGSDPNGIRLGDWIRIRNDDYGTEVVEGEAVVVTAREIAVRREAPEVGTVVVRFPRAGYVVSRV